MTHFVWVLFHLDEARFRLALDQALAAQFGRTPRRATFAEKVLLGAL